MKKTTLAEVAERVGVSARTVSRVVNDEAGISEATRARVKEAIRQAGYRPNLRARSLVTNRTGSIGLVVTYMTDPYFPSFAEAVGTSLRATGQTMLLASNQDDVEEQRRIVDALLAQGVDGIIAFPAHSDLEPIYAATDFGVPVVVVDHLADHPRVATVLNDIKDGARQATRYLIESGHTRIGMVTNAGSLDGGRAWRESTFADEVATAGLDASRRTHARPTTAGGFEATQQLLLEHPDTTAIFAYNDLMAVGVLRAAKEAGRKVPDDLAVVGFDDIDLAAVVTPALTTVRLDREAIGFQAASVLDQMIADPGFQPSSHVVGTTLVRRESA